MSKIKAILSLADGVAQLTGKQIRRLAYKLGMENDVLEGMSANQIKTAVLDESQKYLRNKRKIENRIVGTTALAASAPAAYSVGQFFRDMLGIKTMGDATLKQTAKADVPETPKSKPKIPETPKSKPKPPKKPKSKPKTKSQEELKKSVKKAVNANKGKLITNKKRFGHTDYRKGGMVY